MKRSKPLKPLKGHFNGFLWASSAGKSYPKARSIAVSGRSSIPLARHSQRTGIPRAHPWLFMGVQACRLPALKRSKPLKPLKGHFNGFLWASSAGKSYPKARSIAVSGRSSVLFARHSQPTGIPRPLQWLLTGFQRRQKLPQGRSIAVSGRSRVPFARHSQPTGIPRPHPWLFLGVQACRLPALKRSKPLKPLKGHFNGFLWASSAGKSYPKARSIAVSGRSSVPFARHSQPTGIPRPHPWLFLGVQACRLPALKRSKRLSSAGKSYPKARSIAFSISSMVSETKRENKEPTRSLGVYIYMCVNLRRLLPRPHLYGGVGGTRALAHSILRNRAILLNLYCKQELPMW